MFNSICSIFSGHLSNKKCIQTLQLRSHPSSPQMKPHFMSRESESMIVSFLDAGTSNLSRKFCQWKLPAPEEIEKKISFHNQAHNIQWWQRKRPYEFFLARDDFELHLLAKQRWDMQKLWFSVMLVIKSVVRSKTSPGGCNGKRIQFKQILWSNFWITSWTWHCWIFDEWKFAHIHFLASFVRFR